MIPGGVRRAPKIAIAGAVALAVVLVAVVVLLTSGGSSPEESKNAASPPQQRAGTPPPPDDAKPSTPKFTGNAHPNGNTSNTRAVSGPITRTTVSKLREVWRVPLGVESQSQYGRYSSSPVIVNGVIYSQDLVSNVSAIDLATGEVLWQKSYNSPDQGPNGVIVAGGRVFGATAKAAFALDQRTGRELWKVTLVRNKLEGIDMAPGYHAGKVYISTVPGNNAKFYSGGTKGILWALNAKTGKRIWQFDTAPIETWSKKHAKVNLGGGLWHTPAFDDAGDMYFGVGNAGPFPGTDKYPWGSSRPGKNLYTNSLVKLDSATGKMKWYFQLTPHDLYDWDLQDPPILATVKGKPAVITAGKAGIVIAVSRATGKLLWKRPVGTHNGHDNDPLYASKGRYSKLRVGEEIYPGLLGGVIAPLSTDGNSVFVPVVNNSVTYTAQDEQQSGQTSTGEIVAVDVDTGMVTWEQRFTTSAFGATTVVNDLVFGTTFDGLIHALDAKTGKIVWEKQLPAATNTGVTVHDDMLIAPAGLATSADQAASIVAYRLDRN
jgi:glucose dehydrogenase